MKKLFLLFLAAALIFALVSCGGGTCTEHKDTDKDGKCDVCSTPVEPQKCDECVDGDENGKCDECGEDVEVVEKGPLVLIEDSEAKFQLVISKMSGTKIAKAAEDFVKDMKRLGVTVTLVNDDKAENIKDCEIILGDVDSRGDKYNVDEHTLGIKGELIKRIDNKIIITAGTTSAIVDLFEDFCKDVIGLKSGAKKSDVANVEFEKKDEVIKIQDDYRITAIKIGDTEITGYTIAANLDDQNYLDSARTLQSTLYERAGYWLEIVPLEEATDKSIVFKSVAKGKNGEAGEDGFLMKTVNGQLQILCAYDNALRGALNVVISQIVITQGEYIFKDNSKVMSKNVSVVYYKEWTDIKGDGSTNDFEAIKALHDYANEGGQKVVAQDGKEYYIGNTNGKSIEIKTDVDFGTATFFIDDENADGASRSAFVFIIKSKTPKITYTLNNDPEEILARINAAGGIDIGATTLPLNLGYDAMIIPYDTSKRIYKRWGQSGNTSEGEPMSEVMVVFKNNTVETKSTNMFDFDRVDKIVIYPIDEETLNINGGLFLTIATREDLPWNYINRGISIQRSNVLIDGLEHKVENEPTGNGGQSTMGSTGTGLPGPNYNGFIYPKNCTNFTIQNSKLSGRVHYNNGSYDLGGRYANNLNYINCTQYNMFDENGKLYDENTKYWGIMGTNYCKNITFDGCELSRFDAHAGVYNFAIKNTRMGFIKAVGGGTAIIENTYVYQQSGVMVTLREDYAASWKGDFYIKNVTMVADSGSITVFSGSVHDVDFGFKSQVANVYIENVMAEKYDGTKRTGVTLTLFSLRVDASMFETGIGKHNSLSPAEWIKIKQPSDMPFTNISGYGETFKIYNSFELLPWEEE